MKKIVLLLAFVMFTTGMAFASKYPKYDSELRAVRTVKNAQTKAINEQINDIAAKKEALEDNMIINASEKRKKINEYNAQLNNLAAKKEEIDSKYKADKKRLKRLYKH